MTVLHEARTTARSLGLELLLAALISVVVYVDFWGSSVPSLDAATWLLSVGGGVLAGVVLVSLDARFSLRAYLENDATSLLIMGCVLVLGFLLFPDGLPVVLEVGLVAFGWAEVAARAALAYTLV